MAASPDEYDETNVDEEQMQKMTAKTGLPSTLSSGSG